MTLLTIEQGCSLGIFGEIPLHEALINPYRLQIHPKHWSLWLALSSLHAKQGEEIGAVMILDASDRILLAIPEQVATCVNVHWESISTAVLIDGSPVPKDYQEIGTIHSHHSMDCSFSLIDDRGDLKEGHPIAFHIVSRGYPNWQHDQSFCYNEQRFLGDFGLIPEGVTASPPSALPNNLPIKKYQAPRITQASDTQEKHQSSDWWNRYYDQWLSERYGRSSDSQVSWRTGYDYPSYSNSYDHYDWSKTEFQLEATAQEEAELTDELSTRRTKVSPKELYEFLGMYLDSSDAHMVALEFQYYFMSENEMF